MKLRLALLTAAALTIGATAAVADMTMPAYDTAAVSNSDRSAAEVARDANRKPAEMLAFAGIKPGDTVIDLVPGKDGYFTHLFANAVGPKGHVWSYMPTELDEDMQKMKVALPPDGTVDPKFPNTTFVHKPLVALDVPGKVDVIWTSQNYHDFHDKFMGPIDLAAFNTAVYKKLKSGGTYIVLDHAAAAGSGLRDTDTLHRIDPAVVKQEVEAAGFTFVGESDVLRNPADDHTKLVFDPSIRGKTDQFVYKFRKP